MKLSERGQSNATLAVWALVIALTLTLLFSARVVDQSKTCAIVVLGDVKGEAKTGFQLVAPLVTSLDCYSRQVTVYQTGSEQNKAADYWDYPVEIKTGDGQTALASFNVSYHVEQKNVLLIRSFVATDADDLKERIIANYARSIPRDIAPQFTATDLYTTGRTRFEQLVKEQLRVKFAEFGVTLDDFTLRDINFSEAYEGAIESQQIAKENIETEKYNSEAAIYTAQSAIEKAKGAAEAVKIAAEAEAYALKMKAEAIKNDPALLQLEFIQALKTAQWMMVPWDQVQGLLPLAPTP